jgi:Mg2+/Co2+ transporter CorC
MLMLLLGHLPPTGDQVEWENWRFEVVDMDDKRVNWCWHPRFPRRSNLRRRRRNDASSLP